MYDNEWNEQINKNNSMRDTAWNQYQNDYNKHVADQKTAEEAIRNQANYGDVYKKQMQEAGAYDALKRSQEANKKIAQTQNTIDSLPSAISQRTNGIAMSQAQRDALLGNQSQQYNKLLSYNTNAGQSAQQDFANSAQLGEGTANAYNQFSQQNIDNQFTNLATTFQRMGLSAEEAMSAAANALQGLSGKQGAYDTREQRALDERMKQAELENAIKVANINAKAQTDSANIQRYMQQDALNRQQQGSGITPRTMSTSNATAERTNHYNMGDWMNDYIHGTTGTNLKNSNPVYNLVNGAWGSIRNMFGW